MDYCKRLITFISICRHLSVCRAKCKNLDDSRSTWSVVIILKLNHAHLHPMSMHLVFCHSYTVQQCSTTVRSHPYLFMGCTPAYTSLCQYTALDVQLCPLNYLNIYPKLYICMYNQFVNMMETNFISFISRTSQTKGLCSKCYKGKYLCH